MHKSFPILPFVPRAGAAEPLPVRGAADAVVDLLLFGPDERRGADDPPRRAKDEIWLSSCDGIGLSERAHLAARETHAALFGAPKARALTHWFDELRRRLVAIWAAPGCEAVLAASPGEAEDVFLALARAAKAGPGVTIAAEAPERPAGGPPAGRSFPLRDRYGLALAPEQIDRAVAGSVAEAVAAGDDVVLQVADCSETGLARPSRAAVAALEQEFAGRLLVLIDARQMRAARETIAADLAAGRAVLLSGATFAGGPAGAAALLLPPALSERIKPFALGGALAAQSAALDWPPALRSRRRGAFAALADPGLGLRWEAALAELDAFFAIESAVRDEIEMAFWREIDRHLAAAPFLKAADFRPAASGAPTILPILTFDDHGRAIDAVRLRRALAGPPARSRRPAVHLGGPVALGRREALRLSPSAPQIIACAQRLRGGQNIAAAFQPLADDLLACFAAWSEAAQEAARAKADQ
ncbi:MAG TPA: hypothetical protein VMU18_06210 [Rhodoblastus sp.]|nr:hypothetical protein [Rhodoblastus sp.]